MTDPTIPKILKLGPGRYDAVCGEERLLIRRSVAGPWTIRHRGRTGTDHGVYFGKLEDAKEYAHDWLAEHA